MSSYLWTSEYVSPGHPDKIADQISDTVLDLYLQHDPNARVACETLVKDNMVLVAGEITAATSISLSTIEDAVRTTIRGIGYDHDSLGFNGDSCELIFKISEQAPEISRAVDGETTLGAGDQGIMFGFATRDTPTSMPLAIYLAKALITEAYGGIGERYALRPDMKSQVSLRFEDGVATAVDSVVFSTCHDTSLSLQDVRALFHDELLPHVLNGLPEHVAALFAHKPTYHINPAGAWHIGGPVADCGLTGRKIVVDQYGADCEIGGGAFSGKDPSKVDRSAAYMARHLALRALTEHPTVRSAKVQLAYAIGVAEPVSVRIYDPASMTELPLAQLSRTDLTPAAIIERLQLNSPIYHNTARYGHFGVQPTTINGIQSHAWEHAEE